MRWMARSWPAWAIMSGALVACVGGGGGLSDALATWEPTGSTTERSGSTRENARNTREEAPASGELTGGSAEPGPGAQGVGGGGGGFTCSGTYSCQEVGKKDVETIALTTVNGVCTIAAGKSSITLLADGTLAVDGKTSGSWAPTGTGFTATANGETVVCTAGGGDQSPPSNDAPPEPSGGPDTGGGDPGTGSGGGTVAVDAGVVPPAPDGG